ncbi:hypothetical protein B0J13DRAFT_38368 [Dactylonectria estremocensis]|uniref:Uncharacterized protein n=1 Tax=Dactylonectria estremocensis TaxID=1079267 RepID=A0A9P9FL93_9HYPO|nr:hypothetical protein B0J13DRAFT_38368 [Dactylonectria estremocensis]
MSTPVISPTHSQNARIELFHRGLSEYGRWKFNVKTIVTWAAPGALLLSVGITILSVYEAFCEPSDVFSLKSLAIFGGLGLASVLWRRGGRLWVLHSRIEATESEIEQEESALDSREIQNRAQSFADECWWTCFCSRK